MCEEASTTPMVRVMVRVVLGIVVTILGVRGIAWYTGALKESGRWFAIEGLFSFGPGWWQNVFVERPGHHAYFQYAVPYLAFGALVLGGIALVWGGCRSHWCRAAAR